MKTIPRANSQQYERIEQFTWNFYQSCTNKFEKTLLKKLLGIVSWFFWDWKLIFFNTQKILPIEILEN